MIIIVSCRVIFNKNTGMKTTKIIAFLTGLFLSVNSYSQIQATVDVFPTNVGGKHEFKRVFEQELVYPENSLQQKIGGKVTIQFTILKSASIANVKLISCGTAEIDAEAMRLFKLYLWVPAIKEEQYVNADWSVAFDFDPAKYSKICKSRGFVKFNYLQDAAIDSTGKIYSSGAQMPAYQKGNYALQDFIKENLEYPRQAQLSNIQGTVVLSFVVEPSGLVTNIGVDKPIGGGCAEEAVRLLEMIKWYPGKYDEKFARVKMTYPFYFILNEDFKDNSATEQK
jgi:TonB family protein